MTVSETLMIAIATITMLIGAGHLVIALQTAQPRRKKERAKLANSIRRVMITALIALMIGIVGFLRFLVGSEPPTREDISYLGVSLILIIEAAMLISLALTRLAMRRSARDIKETEDRLMATIGMHSHR